jgi:mRNA interferase MazF
MADLNPRIGTETGKIRPVVIVQTNLINSTHPSTIICPITSQVVPLSNILRVHLIPNKTNGLEKKSDIMIDQVRAIDNQRLLKKIGLIDASSSFKLRENLKVIMDL